MERAISEACIGAHYLLSTVAKISAIASSGKKNINFQHETETGITLNALLLTVFYVIKKYHNKIYNITSLED